MIVQQVGFEKVDLDYLDEFHYLHNDYLLAGEKVKAAEKMSSKYHMQIMEDNNFSIGKNKNVGIEN